MVERRPVAAGSCGAGVSSMRGRKDGGGRRRKMKGRERNPCKPAKKSKNEHTTLLPFIHRVPVLESESGSFSVPVHYRYNII